ncbi:MAG: alpha/beta fold hydrolase [Bacteroidetes bacterium]|nr:alpha/beta fold hydrolase [Bacteroidota bacterium]
MRKSGTIFRTPNNQFTVYYDDQGPDGAPVITFIHGFPLNKSIWDKQIQAFMKEFRVIAFDIRGFGNSASGDQDLSIELFVHEKINGSILHIIAHAGHLSNMENPAEFNYQVKRFAAQVKSN